MNGDETYYSEQADRKNQIIIGTPRISTNKACGTFRLLSDTVWYFDGITCKKTLFYEVEEKWGKYLVAGRSDPFVLALLELAMEKNCDISYEAPMSETLKYNLECYLIPVYSRKIRGFHKIRLLGSVINEAVPSEEVAGTGFSGGVDSFYTVLSHMDSEYSTKRVSHLMLAVNGAAQTGFLEELDQKWFREEMERFTPAAKELGLELIGVNSNVSLLSQHKKLLKGGDSIVTCSFVYALRGLFGTYYWASAYEADVLKFVGNDGGFMEPFSVPLMNVENLHFYHSGCEVSRLEKVEYIARNSVAQKFLTVCGDPVSCGCCFKCLRTMTELYSINKLDLFDKVFDVEGYKRILTSKLAREFTIDHPPFTTDILKSMKRNGVKVPIVVWIKKYIYFKPYYFLKKQLRNNKSLMRLWYLKGWSAKFGEGIKNKELIEARFQGKGK